MNITNTVLFLVSHILSTKITVFAYVVGIYLTVFAYVVGIYLTSRGLNDDVKLTKYLPTGLRI